MERVELSSDWLTGCGAPLPEGEEKGGGKMTAQRLGCEKQLLSLSLFFFFSDARGHIGSTGSPQRPPLDNPGSAEGR